MSFLTNVALVLTAAAAECRRIDAEEPSTQIPATSTPPNHYYCRATAPPTVHGRTWDAAVRALTPEGKCFRPGAGGKRGGRDILIRCDDLHAWIERHPVERAAKVVPAQQAKPADGPIDFDEYLRTRGRGRGAAK
jgi:hypothetical protein